MIVGACSFGATGSSAITDYLKEYDSFQVLDKIEFNWVSAVDGLIDLDYHLNHPHNRTNDSISAIERYRTLCKNKANYFANSGMSHQELNDSTEKFLNSLVQASWYWGEDTSEFYISKLIHKLIKKTGYVRRWELKNKKQWEGYPYKKVYLSAYPDNFDEAARTHVKELMTAMGADFSKPIAMDQPFSGNNPQACFKFFEDPYAIVVDRDPRDHYVFSMTRLLGRNDFIALSSVEDYVKFYRAIRDKQPYKEENDRVLKIQFEDMVYKYDEATKKIQDFLHLPENPNPKAIFDPALSIANTQVWKRFPQFAKEIEFIEKELPEYLYDFTGCPEPEKNAKMFFGKSPKTPRKR